MSSPRVSVIIPARDAEATLARTLVSVDAQELAEPFEVIVVDNGARDGTAAVASTSPVVTRVIRRERGDGPGAARNAGVAAVSGEILAFLDADCWATPGWLAAGVRACAEADLVQGRVLPDPDAALGPFDRTLSVGEAHGLFESANLFIRRTAFTAAGGFPAGLEGPGEAPFGEDVIFGWRAHRAGARTAFCAAALVHHVVVPRGPGGFVAERRRLELFPALAACVPELRDELFYRRWFLSRRTAAFDLALVGGAGGLVGGRRGALAGCRAGALAGCRRGAPGDHRGAPRLAAVAAAAAVGPYLALLAAEARRWGPRRAPVVTLAGVVADAVGAIALARGSVRARTVVG